MFNQNRRFSSNIIIFLFMIMIIFSFIKPIITLPLLTATGQDLTISEERLSTSRADIVSFINVTPQVGLAGVNGNFFAWGDYNNDGNQDLLVNGGKLFKNTGPPSYGFTDVTSSLGLSGSGNGAWADYDNDGYLDFYCAGSDILWHNEGPPTYSFKDVTQLAGNISDNFPTTAVGWGDYDIDGNLDLYISCGEDWNDGDPIYYPDFMYHNNGDGTFTNVTNESGIRNFGGPYYGRSIAWGDYDNDGWPDIYISNYRISQNWLFHNNRNGTFTDVAIDKGVAGEESQRLGNTYYGHTVGSAWADLDNDGDLDLFESDLAHKDLYRGPICGDSQIYRNDGSSNQFSFTDVRQGSGVPEKSIGGGEDELYVGIAMADFDNDGFLDLFIPQIYDLDYSYSYLYHNNGDWTFTNVSNEVGVLVWNTYGGAWCDYNNDGFLDLITGGKGSADPNASYEVHLYENKGNTNSWLQVKLEGKHYNKQCIGVRVKVTTRGPLPFTQIRELEAGMGSHSMQNSIPIEFGFGKYLGKVDIEVHWPSGYIQTIEDVDLNRFLVIEEPAIADLTFINVKILDEHPIQGDIISIEASVINLGNLDAESAVVRFYDGSPLKNGVEIGTPQQITDIDRFYSAKVTTTWDTTAQGGYHDIWAVIEDVEPGELIISNNTMNTSKIIRERNEAPIAVLSAEPIDDLFPDDIVYFNGSQSSDDISVDYYYFDFGDGDSSGWVTNSELSHQYRLPGAFTASLTVKDSDNTESTNIAREKITVTAYPTPNQAPIIDSFTADPIELGALEYSTLKLQAHDPDGDELKFYFSASAGVLNTQEYKSTATWQAPEIEGLYTINAEVSDGELFSNTLSLDINVIVEKINHLPVIEEIVINPSEVNTGENATIIVQATDPDPGDVLTYDYEVTGGIIKSSTDSSGTISTGSIGSIGPKVTWQAPMEAGVYYINVKVSDLGGLTVEQEISILVNELDYPPEILIAESTPSKLANNQATTVLFSVLVTDENGLFDIKRVTIDLTPLAGDTSQKMYDNGKFGDTNRDDGVYSYEYIVPEGLTPGTKILEITVTDYYENKITHDLEVEIEEKKSGKSSQANFIPGFDIEIVIFSLAFVILFKFTRTISKYKPSK